MNKLRFIVLVVILLVANFAHATPSYGQATPNPTPITSLPFTPKFHLVSSVEGWLWTDRLYWTKDAGQSWTDITPPMPNGSAIMTLNFIDVFGMVITSKYDETTHYTTYALFKTTDGGKTWATTPSNISPSYGDPNTAGFFLQLLNENTGWLRRSTRLTSLSFSNLYKTIDGGATWSDLTMPSIDTFNQLPINSPVYFVTERLGWVVDETTARNHPLYRSQDGGQTWQIQTVGIVPSGISERNYMLPQFVNAEDGLLTVTDQKSTEGIKLEISLEIYFTHDGGITWQLDSTLAGNGPVRLVDNTQWIGISAHRSLVQRITNQAAVPMTVNENPVVSDIFDLDFVSPSTAWAASFHEICPPNAQPGQCIEQHQLLYTNDGGQTWKPLALPPLQITSDILSTVISTAPGFDKACLPDPTTLIDWHDSANYKAPFTTVGFYFDTNNDFCSHNGGNGNRTAGNIVNLSTHGWSFATLWVGPQAIPEIYQKPGREMVNTDLRQAYLQGIQSANQAADAAVGLGLGGSVIYYDFEGYVCDGNTCNPPVDHYATYHAAMQSLIAGWSSQLRARGFKAGLYDSTINGHIADFANITSSPDVTWIAQYRYGVSNPNNKYDPSVTAYSVSGFDNRYWPTHQRLYQYANDFASDQYGDSHTSISPIDANAIDGVVATQILTPGVPTIISPVNGAVLPNTTTTVTFVIQAGTPTYVGVMNWWLQVATDQNFTQLAIDYTSLLPSLSVAQLGHGILYYVRVRQSDQQPQGVVLVAFNSTGVIDEKPLYLYVAGVDVNQQTEVSASAYFRLLI